MITMEDRSLTQVSSVYNFEESLAKKEINKHEMEYKKEISSNGDIDGYTEEWCSEISSSGDGKANEPKLAKSFPWLAQFVKLCRAEIGVTNINTLENLMKVYLEHIGKSVIECYVKPNRAAKLKKCMNDTLVLFHMLYSDIKKPLEHSSYLDKMSDLMAYYIDMEIKASRRGKESLPKIASKLTSSLYLFLDHSIDHILDAILKTKNMTKSFCELCTFIFRRILKEGPGRAVYEMTYVRYILVFKMWKRVVKGAEERRKVMKLAATKLFPPSQFRDKLKSGLLCGVLPKIPKSRPDITMFLMQAKFCVKEKSKEFLKVVADPKQQCVLGTSLSADLDRPLFFGDGADSSNNSNSDDQEETSGSSILMNDIWSSMTLEAGLRDHLRLAEVTGLKSKKSNKLKKKSSNDTSKVESTKNLKDKEKKIKKKMKKLNKCDDGSNKSCRVVEGMEKKPCIVAQAAPEVNTAVVHSTNDVSNSCTQTLEEPAKESAESSPLIPIENIKVEADSSDDVCFVGIIRKGDDDLVTGSGKEAEILDIAREVEIRTDSTDSPVKLERPGSVSTISGSTLPANQHDIFLYDQTPSTEWSPAPAQNFFNNAVCDFINGYLPDFDIDSANSDLDNRDIYDMLDMGKSLLQNKHKEIFPKEIFQGNDLAQLPLDEEMRNIGLDVSSLPSDSITAGSGGKEIIASEAVTVGEQQRHSPVRQEEHPEKIDNMIESFKEQGRYSEKSVENSVVINNSTTNASSEVETKSSKDESMHSKTLRSDHSIFISQQQFRSLYITEVIPPSIPVPSPPKMDSSFRCDCDQCNANYEALQTNYKKLTAYKNSKINNANTYKKPTVQEDDLVKGGSEEETEPGKNPRMEHHSSLPLKKRKALQTSTSLKKETIETSYPCTPMMSIAVALEKSKIGLPASTTACSVLDYTTASSAPQYSYSSSVNSASSELAQAYSNSNAGGYSINNSNNNNNNNTGTPQNPYTDSNKTVTTSKCIVNAVQATFQRSFKTPAQLKEGITVPTSDLNAAQDLINFAQNSHDYFTNTQHTNRKSSKRSRTKTKTDRHSSKKKKN